MRKKVLHAAIRLHTAGDKVNGVAIASEVGCSQSNCSMHLNALVKSGHMKRAGNKFWPALTPDGQAYVMPVTKVPDGYAKGYKPMTQKIGHIGRAVT